MQHSSELAGSAHSGVAVVLYHVAFSLYTGWVGAATILGSSILLKRTQWDSFTGESEEAWAITMAVIAFGIYTLTSVYFCDPIYGVVFSWLCLWNVVEQTGAVQTTFLVLGILNTVVQIGNAVRWGLRCAGKAR